MEKRPRQRKSLPDCRFEESYWKEGYRYIAGVDEAGRGPLAGPVVASSVILPHGFQNSYGINDSKQLTSLQREELFFLILEKAVSVGICIVPEYFIDEINIYHSSLMAMHNSLYVMDPPPDMVLVDGMDLACNEYNYKKIIKGDCLSVSIASASIIAKVTRDNIMLAYHYQYPQYGFNQHNGYPTLLHKKALKEFGILSIHRKTYKTVKELL
ncbi:MAG: ribonuclease HII [Spirochaetes bacterium]|nr:ribonuclease HII [Spirochaetota bacterium]